MHIRLHAGLGYLYEAGGGGNSNCFPHNLFNVLFPAVNSISLALATSVVMETLAF